MSKREEKSWSLWCDWPDCKERFEYGDYSIFGDGWDAEDMLIDSDWKIDTSGEKHYCSKHPAVWSSDYEDGTLDLPDPPYLLISEDPDGRVSFVAAEESA